MRTRLPCDATALCATDAKRSGTRGARSAISHLVAVVMLLTATVLRCQATSTRAMSHHPARDTALPPELAFEEGGNGGTTRGSNNVHVAPPARPRAGFFSFLRNKGPLKRTTTPTTEQPHLVTTTTISVAPSPAAARGASTASVSWPASATPAAASAVNGSATTPPAAAAPTRRRWMRYPVRVPILSLLLVSLLARTSEGWTSIAGFLCGFLLFEGFSAPDTGQPNRIDGMVRRLMISLQRCRGRRKRRARHSKRKKGQMSRIRSVVVCFTLPFTWCFRGRSRAPPAEDDASTSSLLLPAEEDTDVLLDVAVSVTEDATPAPPSADGISAIPSPSTMERASSTPLHPMNELIESLTDSIADSLAEAMPSLPTVTLLDSADVSDAATPSANTTSVVGGVAQWQHMSISLRFTLHNFQIHLHHWVYLLIICLFLFLEQVYWSDHAASYPVYAFASAFCLGGSVQGLKYADWARVIWRKQKEQQEKKQQERRNSRTYESASASATPSLGNSAHSSRRNSRDDSSSFLSSASNSATSSPFMTFTRSPAEMPIALSTCPSERMSLLTYHRDALNLPSATDNQGDPLPRLLTLSRSSSTTSPAAMEEARPRT